MSEISDLTALLRRGPDPFWACLRDTIRARGLDPSTALLADNRPQGEMSEFGIVVSPEGGVYEFALASPSSSWADASLVEWLDITDRWSDTPYRAQVAIALQLRDATIRETPSDGSGGEQQ